MIRELEVDDNQGQSIFNDRTAVQTTCKIFNTQNNLSVAQAHYCSLQ